MFVDILFVRVANKRNTFLLNTGYTIHHITDDLLNLLKEKYYILVLTQREGYKVKHFTITFIWLLANTRPQNGFKHVTNKKSFFTHVPQQLGKFIFMKKCLLKKRVELPKGWFGTTT